MKDTEGCQGHELTKTEKTNYTIRVKRSRQLHLERQLGPTPHKHHVLWLRTAGQEYWGCALCGMRFGSKQLNTLLGRTCTRHPARKLNIQRATRWQRHIHDPAWSPDHPIADDEEETA
eukprot:5442879-Amphidinium_carterae.2